ncbi:MAG: reverse transcriptase domain-containing protein [Candidatus Sphingomonas colombiensis]|nr:reverse transcriptase domain-containing protein [Sphingomonas sp.]WEK43194.1 MAG: reverse transcriptase domain-containing protein [Sphingomonas sp.]
MRDLYSHRFTLPNGVTICIPSEKGRGRGKEIAQDVSDRWTPKSNYFHQLEGGHVAAARRHHTSTVIAKLDLAKFYHQVGRSKVHRALKLIGTPQKDAWEAACDSTVERDPGQRNFSLPFGYVQSPILASIALDYSALGTALTQLNTGGCLVSAYVDDIIVSADNADAVNTALDQLRAAAGVAGFAINEKKSEGPASEITAFNIHLGSGRMEITEKRMGEFEVAIRDAHPERIMGILNYVNSVNVDQMEALAATIGRTEGEPSAAA